MYFVVLVNIIVITLILHAPLTLMDIYVVLIIYLFVVLSIDWYTVKPIILCGLRDIQLNLSACTKYWIKKKKKKNTVLPYLKVNIGFKKNTVLGQSDLKSGDDLTPTAMSGAVHWRWLEVKDCRWYHESAFIKILEPPSLINAQGTYTVPKMHEVCVLEEQNKHKIKKCVPICL